MVYSFNAVTDGGIASYGNVFQCANARREDGTIRIIGPSAQNNITTISIEATTSTSTTFQSSALSTATGSITTSDVIQPETTANSTSTQTDSAIPTSTTTGAADSDSYSGRGGISTAAIAGICVSAGVAVIALCLLLFMFQRRRKVAKTAAATNSPISPDGEEQIAPARRQAEEESKLHGNELYGSPADVDKGRQELGPGVERHELDPGAERPHELGAEGRHDRFELP